MPSERSVEVALLAACHADLPVNVQTEADARISAVHDNDARALAVSATGKPWVACRTCLVKASTVAAPALPLTPGKLSGTGPCGM